MRAMRGSDRRLASVVTAAIVLAAAGAYLPLLVPADLWWGYSPGNATAQLVYALLWIPVIVLTIRRDPTNRMWVLILAFLATSVPQILGFLRIDVAWTIQALFNPLNAVVLGHLCLAFPTGRLRHRIDIGVIGAAYLIAIPVQVLGMLVWDPTVEVCTGGDWCPRNLLLVSPDGGLYDVLRTTALLAPPIALGVILELLRHWRSASRAGRRALAPLAIGAPIVFGTLGLYFVAPVLGFAELQDFLHENAIMDLTWFLTPCLFLLGAAWTRLGRGAVADLAIVIGRGVQLGGLEAAIRRALRDPSLRLAFPAPGGDGFVGPDGQRLQLAADRAAAPLERDGELLAVIDYDPVVDREDPGLVAAAVQVARLALDNERLAAQVRAQLAEVRTSRQRIVEAADAERRRVERDLHDGAQQRLVALSMRLELARETAGGASDLIDATTAELGLAIADVRGLARGLHPPILTEAGLRAAVESLAERTRIPLNIDIPAGRYPVAVEVTAYHVIAETLANLTARPDVGSALVGVADDGHHLRIRIDANGGGPADDGSAAADPDAGAGLRGLLDRVAAVGGSLSVDGAGMRVDAVVPV